MAMVVCESEQKWTREKIVARVNETLLKYIDFDDMAKNGKIPFEDQPIELDSLDLVEISMYLEDDFQIELDLEKEKKFFSEQEKKFVGGIYTPRDFIDFMCKKLNVPMAAPQQPRVVKPKPQHTTDKDIAILMRIARPLQLKRAIRYIYGINVPLNELRALKSFTDYQEVIRRAINNQNSK